VNITAPSHGFGTEALPISGRILTIIDSSVLSFKHKDSTSCAHDAGEDSVLVFFLKLLVREICGENGGKPSVLSRVEEIIEACNGKLADKFRAEVINDEKVALEVLLTP
jgi:hypothetical protein